MDVYLACWMAGGAVGTGAGLLVLRARGALSPRASVVFALAVLGTLAGAKLQYRLRYLPLLDAIAGTPGELLVPGYHLPLGLVVGFGAAMAAAALVRLPLLPVADALAMTGAAMMPVGRIGCWLSHCCSGTVCPAWLRWACVVQPRDSEAYWAQVAAGLLPPGAPEALPVHPLPFYFAVLGVGLVMIFGLQLRRGARPGTLILTGFILYPLGQLALEPLRAVTSEPQRRLMTQVLLAAAAAATLAVGASIAVRQRGPRH